MNQLAAGWNSWNTRSVRSHLLPPEDLPVDGLLAIEVLDAVEWTPQAGIEGGCG